MTTIDAYLDAALAGNHRGAWRLARDLIESGATFQQVVDDLLVPAQYEIGERWYRREATVSDEHLVTGITESALEHLAALTVPSAVHGSRVVVCCPEREAHILPAQIFANLLRTHGWSVAFLGASNPPRDVGVFLERIRPVALIVSSYLPIHFGGVATLAEVAHRAAVPALAGGRSLQGRPRVGARLGSDGEASDLDAVNHLLLRWQEAPPTALAEPTLRLEGSELDAHADSVAATASVELLKRWAPRPAADRRLLDRAEDGLAMMTRFAAAAVLVDDPTILEDHVAWLDPLMATFRLPDDALVSALEVTAEAVAPISPRAEALLSGCIDDLTERHALRPGDPPADPASGTESVDPLRASG